MVRLTAALISAIQDGADIRSITSLIVPRRDLDQLVGLDVCERLIRLDLSDNRLSTLEGITLCTSLQWLSVAGNQLTSLKGVENLTKLTVLNASRNRLASFNEIAVLTDLRAVILNDNEITKVCRLDRLINLNTVVLSRNPIRNLGNFATKLISLKKTAGVFSDADYLRVMGQLSLSHCQVQVLGASLKRCVALEELRLAHNQLSSLPQELERNGRLSILDIGTNHLQTWSDIQILHNLHSLVNLNLRGNPLCSKNDYDDEVANRLPHLQILDGHPFQDTHKYKGKKFKSKDTDPKTRRKPAIDSGTFQQVGEESELSTSIIRQGRGDGTKDRPFLDLVFVPEVTDDVVGRKIGTKSKKRKDDSGVVSIFEGARSKPLSGKSKNIGELFMPDSEIGTGGPSTWGDPSPSSPTVHHSTQTQRFDHAADKPYSRWALKKKNDSSNTLVQ